MRIDLIEGSGVGLPQVRTVHGNTSIVWQTEIYARTKFADVTNLFKEVNGFWATLQPTLQEEIFQLYISIFQTMEEITDPRRCNDKLRVLVKKFYELHDLTAWRQWVMLYGDIRVPVTMRDEYDTRDIKSWTYLRNEYTDLMVMAIYFRPMIPVFGDYIERIRKAVGNNNKEKFALGIIATSKLNDLPAMNRFTQYIEARVEYERLPNSAVINAMGPEELPSWLRAKALLRRVANGEVNVLDDKSSIISNVHHFITNALKSMDRNFNGRITDKEDPSDSSDDDNISVVENHKVKQAKSDGVGAILGHYSDQIEDIAVKIDPTIDPVKLELACRYTLGLHKLVTMTHHTTVVQWVLHRAIAGKAIPSLNKQRRLQTIAITQALLWHWGFHDLAVLVTASTAPYDEDDGIDDTDGRGSRIQKDLVEKLLARNPYSRRENTRSQNERQNNVCYRAIDIISKEMVDKTWVLSAPPELLALVTKNAGPNRMLTPPDIRTQLAKLLLHPSLTGSGV